MYKVTINGAVRAYLQTMGDAATVAATYRKMLRAAGNNAAVEIIIPEA
jgi:hypothetical protein